MNNRLKGLRLVAWLEGLSYLLLLLVAMPLKYLADQPQMVRITGMIHGVLFVLFVIIAIQVKIEHDWSMRHMLKVIGTSLVPFGMVLFDRIEGDRPRR